ncbi:MAG: glycosyltransferase, partial [Rhizobiales bacterium]|nr:glycosyltransferase [Hyphomicrobiales bacterium]
RWRAEGRIEREERRALLLVDRAWVCSGVDRARLQRIAGTATPIDVVMNGIPRGMVPTAIPDLPGRADGWPVLLFVGHLGYPPNVAAGARLAGHILPEVRKVLPGARLILAGRYPKPRIRELAGLPGVEVVENPPDVAPLLARAHVSVVPLATAGGTRIKIIEAMAAGIPVVATPLAAEGLGLVDGTDILLAGSDEAFARAVIDLCSNPSRMEVLRRHAWESVLGSCGASAIAGAVRRGMDLAIEEGQAPDDRSADGRGS